MNDSKIGGSSNINKNNFPKKNTNSLININNSKSLKDIKLNSDSIIGYNSKIAREIPKNPNQDFESKKTNKHPLYYQEEIIQPKIRSNDNNLRKYGEKSKNQIVDYNNILVDSRQQINQLHKRDKSLSNNERINKPLNDQTKIYPKKNSIINLNFPIKY